MQKFKTLFRSRLAVVIGGMVLALGMAWPLTGTAQDKSDSANDSDSHAQHKDKQSHGDQNLATQVAELHAKVARLEAALKHNHDGTPSATPDKGGLTGTQDESGDGTPSDRVSAKFQNCTQCHQKRPSGPLPPSHLEDAGNSGKGTKQGGMAGMSDNRKPSGGMGMMGGKGMGMGMMGGKGMGSGMPGMKGMEKPGMKGMEMGKKGMEMGMKGMEMMGGKGMDGGKGMEDEKEDMSAMGGSKAEMGGPTTGMMEQRMTQLMRMMQQMMEMEMKMMEMKMKMMDKGMGTEADEMAKPDPHAGHQGSQSGAPSKGDMKDMTPDPADQNDANESAEADKDLPAQVRELQTRITALEAALKTKP